MRLFYLVLGGAAGTVSRYLLSAVVHENAGHRFPYGTFIVNGLGCLIVGFLTTVNDGHVFSDENMKVLLAVGFCGAFTTFSTFILESAHLIKEGQTLHAFINIILSVAAGFAAFVVGNRLGKLT